MQIVLTGNVVMYDIEYVQKTELWESEKAEADMEKYEWKGSQSQLSLNELLVKMPSANGSSEVVGKYAEAVTHLHNEG